MLNLRSSPEDMSMERPPDALTCSASRGRSALRNDLTAAVRSLCLAIDKAVKIAGRRGGRADALVDDLFTSLYPASRKTGGRG